MNCDPTYELEEMMIESKPLHKKKYKKNKKKKEVSKENCAQVFTLQFCCVLLLVWGYGSLEEGARHPIVISATRGPEGPLPSSPRCGTWKNNVKVRCQGP